MSVEVQTKPQIQFLPETRLPVAPVPSADRPSVMELWRVLMKRRFVVLVVAVLSIATALWYAVRTPSVYESVARIQIRPQESANIGLSQLIEQKAQDQPQNALQTEVAILRSDSVLFRTAQSLNLLDSIRANSAAEARKKGLPRPRYRRKSCPRNAKR